MFGNRHVVSGFQRHSGIPDRRCQAKTSPKVMGLGGLLLGSLGRPPWQAASAAVNTDVAREARASWRLLRNFTRRRFAVGPNIVLRLCRISLPLFLIHAKKMALPMYCSNFGPLGNERHVPSFDMVGDAFVWLLWCGRVFVVRPQDENTSYNREARVAN